MTNTLILVLPTVIPFVASNNFPATPRRFSRFPADIKHDGFHQWLFFIGFVGAGIVAIWPSQSQVKDGTSTLDETKIAGKAPSGESDLRQKRLHKKKQSCWGRIVYKTIWVDILCHISDCWDVTKPSEAANSCTEETADIVWLAWNRSKCRISACSTPKVRLILGAKTNTILVHHQVKWQAWAAGHGGVSPCNPWEKT